ncbi:hypothetical protein C1645_841825 [Glomus cerebriforme]|uniref:Uncharacterized protein n=1 Tax=Glomus cerebriforme TaxID=658196 RepID=A0A397RZ74_9GLOM|nr:hypothetical protein C1645_841825 [Glomus cerebriforme]
MSLYFGDLGPFIYLFSLDLSIVSSFNLGGISSFQFYSLATSVLRKEMPDNYSKNKSTNDNDDEEELPEDETIFNDTSFITYDKLFE